MWPMLGLVFANVMAYVTRKVLPAYTFFHTNAGAVVLGAMGAVTTSVTPIFQSGSVTWIALAWAAAGGVSSFFSALNPSTTSDDPPAKSPASKLGAQLILPVLLLISFPACQTCKTVDSVTCARKVLIGIDAADGAAARIAKRWTADCGAKAKALGVTAEADAAYTKCEQTGSIMVLTVKEVESSVATASDAVDVAEKAGGTSADYASIIEPLKSGVKNLYKIFTDAGVTLPVIAALLGVI